MTYLAEKGAILMGGGVVVAGIAADERDPGLGAVAAALVVSGGLWAFLSLGPRTTAMKLRWLAVWVVAFCLAAPVIFAVESDAALWIVAIAIAFVAPFVAGLASPDPGDPNHGDDDGEKDWGRLA
jgi:hypothetical protein